LLVRLRVKPLEIVLICQVIALIIPRQRIRCRNPAESLSRP
jgi:hypothetical protein